MPAGNGADFDLRIAGLNIKLLKSCTHARLRKLPLTRMIHSRDTATLDRRHA